MPTHFRSFTRRRLALLGAWLQRKRGRLLRRLAWVVPLFLLIMSLLHWMVAGTIPSRGGLYFFKEVILPVPHFAQGDPRWKEELLGPTEATLHAEGCAVASAAMVLASYGVDLDPARLNTFLNGCEGYTPEGWIYWEKAAEFQPGVAQHAYEAAPSYARIDLNLLRGNPVIVRVRLPKNNHFVVIAGKRGRDYLIVDPGTNGNRGLYPLHELAPKIEGLRYYRRLAQVPVKAASETALEITPETTPAPVNETVTE